MKIGITGSLSSGKSTVAKILSNNKRILFSADDIVQELYRSKLFKNKIKNKFRISGSNLKQEVKEKIMQRKIKIKSLGKLIHPIVRKSMRNFYLRNRKRKILFFEIPLLIESNLMSFFDYIILVVAPKSQRFKRYVKNGGNAKMFNILDKSQMPPNKKIKHCDYLIVNKGSKSLLKKKVNDIVRKYK